MVEMQRLAGSEKDPNETFAVLCRKSELERLQDTAAGFGAARIDVPKDFALTAAAEKETLSSEISGLEKKEEELIGELSSSADEGLRMARNYGDYWTILHNRLEAMETGEPTEEVLIWEFWTPKSFMKKVEYTVDAYSRCV